jgi:hypothetical protein
MVFGPAQAASLRMNVFKFVSKNGRDNPQKLAALLKARLGVSHLQERLALNRHGAARRKNPPGLEIIHDVVEQRNFVTGKERKQMLKEEGKSGENTFTLIVRMQSAHGVFVKYQDVSGHYPVDSVGKDVFGQAAFQKNKCKLVFTAGFVHPRF